MLVTLLLFLDDLGGSDLLLIMTGILLLPVVVLLVAFWRWSRRPKTEVAVAPISAADEFSKLQQLHEQDVLTVQEFEKQK